MKTVVQTLSLLFFACASAMSQTQAQMTKEARTDFERADAAMNRSHNKLLTTLDAQAQADLKKSQEAWAAYRDAQAELEAAHAVRGGSMYGTILYATKATLTQIRTKEVRRLLTQR